MDINVSEEHSVSIFRISMVKAYKLKIVISVGGQEALEGMEENYDKT
jgi:hypothetical protein